MIHMHFWIDKRSQGCRFDGRHWVPPSISGSRRADRLCRGVYPKLMVTPVHRFQSIGGPGFAVDRHSRSSNYQQHRARFPVHPSPLQDNVQNNNNNNGGGSAQRNNAVNRSITLLSSADGGSATPRTGSQNTRLKCGVWSFFALVTFFIAGAKFYFHGGTIGMEALAFCSFLILILIIGGLVSLYETVILSRRRNQNTQISVQLSNEQNESNEEPTTQVPNIVQPMNNTELPPPPYHIAIMLPSQIDGEESLTIIRDSPPPSYDKAVT